jgi:hypothetical protein
MSSIDWSSIDVKDLSVSAKRQLSDVCHNFNKFDNFLIQFVLLVIMVHHIAIIYNAERAMDLASITNKCVGAPATDIKAQCEIAIWAGRIGVGMASLMLLIVRSLDTMSVKGSAIVQLIFGVSFLVTFIVSVSCAAIAKGKISACTATQPPNQVGNPVLELETALGYMVNWSAIGVTASTLYVVYYSLRAFMPGTAKSATELASALESNLEASSSESSAAGTPMSP